MTESDKRHVPTAMWPAARVEMRPIEMLIPSARNARTHSEAQIAQLAASIQEFGWTIPVLVDEAGVLIAGHGRVLAARSLGLSEAPVMVARGWTDAQKRAYALADNKLALNAGWDEELLALELGTLRDLGFNAALTGFDLGEIGSLLGATPTSTGAGAGSLAAKFGIPPFSVLNAREGWWQDRKAAWIALGIESELGRGDSAGSKLTMSETIQALKPDADQALTRSRRRPTAEPGGSKMPAADYGKTKARGDGRGRAVRG